MLWDYFRYSYCKLRLLKFFSSLLKRAAFFAQHLSLTFTWPRRVYSSLGFCTSFDCNPNSIDLIGRRAGRKLFFLRQLLFSRIYLQTASIARIQIAEFIVSLRIITLRLSRRSHV